MRFDQLTHPFGIKQIDETLGCVFRLHQICVVAERDHVDARGGEQALRVAVLGWIKARDLLRYEWLEPAITLPGDEVRRIGGIDNVGRKDVRGAFLRQSLKLALRASALDTRRD